MTVVKSAIVILISAIFSLDILAEPAVSSDRSHILKDAKAAYSLRQFDYFFAIAQWARLISPANLSDQDKDRLFALELLGLARHCLWLEISRLTENQNLSPYSEKAFSLIAVKQEYQRFVADQRSDGRSIFAKVISAREHWSISLDQAKLFKNPKNLRIKVVSKCAEN